MPFPDSPRKLIAGIALVVMPAVGCVSSSDVQKIDVRLADVQEQLLQLQKQGASKAEIKELETAILGEMRTLQRTSAEVDGRLVELSARIAELEGKLEETNFRLAQLSQQIAATNQELQAVRSAALVQRAPEPPPPASKAEPQAIYETAYSDYQRGNYDLAILGFLQYLEGSPQADLADNATYWLGECYYRQGKFQQAIAQFDEVLSRYESSDRIPSALLKKGYAYLELDQRAQAVVQLQHVVCDYAGTDEARLARQRLEALGIDVQC